ncbi:hypothetical protein, partial [uncultured Spongiibacter sp.]|uniref:hypothetical protein n=1 Tax=uncultured Spongiibacter sp. TaxID=870896 RepID=UPI0032B204ED
VNWKSHLGHGSKIGGKVTCWKIARQSPRPNKYVPQAPIKRMGLGLSIVLGSKIPAAKRYLQPVTRTTNHQTQLG